MLAIAFMLLYRLPEAFSVKLLYPFFSDAVAEGGLGLDKAAFGLVYGTAGVIALLAGGILGGLAISRYGLKKCLLPSAKPWLSWFMRSFGFKTVFGHFGLKCITE